jgi:HEPN domain-containing protein
MNDVAEEWLEKAEADFGTAQREFAAKPSPNYDAVCFHAQQCIEKLMKGLLINLGNVPPRTHDLATLNDLLSTSNPSWTWPPEDLRLLTRAAVTFRYPGESAEREEAQAALDACIRLRLRLRELNTDG